MLDRATRSERMRAVARRVPGLSRAYWRVHRRAILRRGYAAIDFPGEPLVLRATTQAIVRKRLHPRAKEPWTVDWLQRNVGGGDVVYDIGANVGAYSLIAARLDARAHVVAFEPAYANYASLCDNVLLNRLGDRITPLPVVLAEKTRLATLGCDTTEAGEATHELDGGEHTYDQPVLAYALDDLIETFGLPVPALLKLDVDGAEAAVLTGARRTLAAPSLRSVVIEIDREQTDAVLERLGAASLELVARFDERDGKPLPGIWYGIFDRRGA